ncbi:hypothetical protein ACFH04_01400 [Streptomyces noboritoensis]|uniref:Uncharacterized protein n=1 Tax=Streptomyces noboritoensis TaxID=67337 RepID=A0ABV6T9D0_9ACTN
MDRCPGPLPGSRGGVGHQEKWRLAPDLLDTPAGWDLLPPVVVADAAIHHTVQARGYLAFGLIGGQLPEGLTARPLADPVPLHPWHAV